MGKANNEYSIIDDVGDLDGDNLGGTAIDEQYFKIRYWSSTHSFYRIAEWMEKGKLNIPDLQRGYVWKKEMASKLIDSILLGIPLPTFFLYQNDDEGETVDIIDGLQRITVIASYINSERLPGEKDIFKLSKSLSINQNWRGKSFLQLTQIQQNKIKDSDASIVFFEQRFPNIKKAEIKRYVFERLNTGGVKLSSQEIRNAVYPGILMIEVKKLSQKWNNYEKRFSDYDFKKYKIDELILRIIMIYSIKNSDFFVAVKNDLGEIITVKAKKAINLKTK